MQIFLIVLGALLIFLNVRFINDQKRHMLFKKKNDNELSGFAEVLMDKEQSTTELDVRIAELRREFTETILELQKETVELSEKVELMLEIQSTAAAIAVERVEIAEEEAQEETIIINNEEKTVFSKAEQVGRLLENGYSIDEICENLGIGRGEVLLIKKLYQK